MAWEAGSWDEDGGRRDEMEEVGTGRYSLATFLRLLQPFLRLYGSRNIFPLTTTFLRLLQPFPVYRNPFHTPSEPIPFLGILPTFRSQSQFSELIHSFGLIQIRFAYIHGTIHISVFVYITAAILWQHRIRESERIRLFGFNTRYKLWRELYRYIMGEVWEMQ